MAFNDGKARGIGMGLARLAAEDRQKWQKQQKALEAGQRRLEWVHELRERNNWRRLAEDAGCEHVQFGGLKARVDTHFEGGVYRTIADSVFKGNYVIERNDGADVLVITEPK